MGMSADATLAWGVVVHDEEGDYDSSVHEKIEELLDGDWDLEKLFEFTEPRPWDNDAHWASLSREERQPILDAWNARKDEAIPVEFDHAGTYDYAVRIVVIKRTNTSVNWGVKAIEDRSSRYAHPTSDEVGALNKVLDAIEFKGDREPKLLLFASYG